MTEVAPDFFMVEGEVERAIRALSGMFDLINENPSLHFDLSTTRGIGTMGAVLVERLQSEWAKASAGAWAAIERARELEKANGLAKDAVPAWALTRGKKVDAPAP